MSDLMLVILSWKKRANSSDLEGEDRLRSVFGAGFRSESIVEKRTRGLFLLQVSKSSKYFSLALLMAEFRVER